MEQFNVAGLASGFDWNAMVDQLMAIERIPQRRLREEQTKNTEKVDALATLEDKLGKLRANVTSLKTGSLFNTKAVTLSDDSLNITASASTSAAKGNFEIAVSQLATTTKRLGATDVVANMGDETSLVSSLRLASDIEEGTFSVNGQTVTVGATDTLQDVFDAISTATGGVVSASYDSLTDTVSLDSASGELQLGAEDDSSNFLAAMKLHQLEVTDGGGGTATVSSRGALGVVDTSDTIANSGIGGPITGAGTFHVNGVAIDFDADNESMSALMQRVNSSAANVTMSYDSTTDQFRLVNNETGAYAMNVADSGNGLLAAIGLTGAADVGKDLQFSVDGGATRTSRSNSIGSEEHGIEGVTVEAGGLGTQTVTVAQDSSELAEKVNGFISAFNDVQDFIAEKTKISVNDGEVTAGVLAGNREISALDSRLRSLAFGAVDGLADGSLFRLEHLGIDFISGTSKLEIKDSAKLEDALSNELSTLEEFFSSAEGNLGGRLDDFMGNYLQSDGIMDTMSSRFTSRNTEIDEQIKEMERRLEFKRESLVAGFIAMETAQSNLSSQSSALAALGQPTAG